MSDTPHVEGDGKLSIQASFEVIEEPGGETRFADEFYRRMFDRFPELKEKFSGVVLAHQGALLMSALGIIATSTAHMRPGIADYLIVLGHRHYQRGITGEDYDKFRSALLETLRARLDGRWHIALEEQWGRALDATIATMLKGHREGQVIY